MIRKKLSVTELRKLEKLTTEFFDKHKISCPEAISQNDNVIENAYELIEKIGDIIDYYDYDEEELIEDDE